MMVRETRIAIFILFALAWVIGAAGDGYGGPPPEGQIRLAADRSVSTSDVEIYRSNDRDQANRLKMIDLCRRLEDNWTRAGANGNTEVEVYRDNTKPGETEYRREVRESNQFGTPAGEQRTIELCRQLEVSDREPQKSEVRVYRETTVPPEGEEWSHRQIHPEDQD